jgi:hypothetical protein
MIIHQFGLEVSILNIRTNFFDKSVFGMLQLFESGSIPISSAQDGSMQHTIQAVENTW